jgi:molybdopterin molybdotransferase
MSGRVTEPVRRARPRRGHDRGRAHLVEDHLAAHPGLLPTPDPIELRLADALGLVLADDVVSEVSVPAFPNSAMDGYAVVAADLAERRRGRAGPLPVVGEVLAGARSPRGRPGRCVRIMTGAPLPPGADAVVPVETTSGDGPGGVPPSGRAG